MLVNSSSWKIYVMKTIPKTRINSFRFTLNSKMKKSFTFHMNGTDWNMGRFNWQMTVHVLCAINILNKHISAVVEANWTLLFWKLYFYVLYLFYFVVVANESIKNAFEKSEKFHQHHRRKHISIRNVRHILSVSLDFTCRFFLFEIKMWKTKRHSQFKYPLSVQFSISFAPLLDGTKSAMFSITNGFSTLNALTRGKVSVLRCKMTTRDDIFGNYAYFSSLFYGIWTKSSASEHQTK